MGGGGGGSSGGSDEPKGVTIKGGKMQASTPTSRLDRTTNFQLEEKATTAGKEFGVMSIEERRQKAISQLEERLANPQLPRFGIAGVTTGIMADISLKRQIEALKAGADPNFARSETGQYVAVGVTTPTGTMGQRGDIVGMTAVQRQAPLTEGAAVTPEVTPEVTDVTAPDEAGTMLSSTERGRKRTRSKRFGGAGDFGEGILVRNTSK